MHSQKNIKNVKLARLRLSFALVLLLILPVSSGCSLWKKEEAPVGVEKFRADVEQGKSMLVGDYVNFRNNTVIPLRGYGLVQNLPGTGGNDVNSYEWEVVDKDLLKTDMRDVRGLLAHPSTAVVNVTAMIRPGIQKGDRVDVEVMLPQGTEATSLRGGWLVKTDLEESLNLGTRALTGRTKAYAEGPILIADPQANEKNNPTALQKGFILGGGINMDARPIMLMMKPGNESEFITARIATEINNRFFVATSNKTGMATAKSDVLIQLDIHPDYANNVSRYLRVIQSIACYENPNTRAKRIARLAEELFIPEKSQHAALQLEAIGKPGIAALQGALKSPNAEVRFHAATSLAYLGDTTPARILAELAKTEPAFRVYCLEALGRMRNDMDAAICLQELLHVPSAETRYAAFRALNQRNPHDQVIRGEYLGQQFYYHGINTTGPAMVHLSRSKRPEIVLFGSGIYLKQPFFLDAGATILVNGQTPGEVTITRLTVSGVDEKRTVPNDLDKIIRTIVELGGKYPDVMQLLCQADMAHCLSCRLEIDSLPEANRIYRRVNQPEEDNADQMLAGEVPDKPKKQNIWQKMNPANWFHSEKSPENLPETRVAGDVQSIH